MASVKLTAPVVQAGQTLFSSSSVYTILEFIGEGCYGKVAKCQNLATKETVAVKILKKDFVQDTEKEVSMLKDISVLNPDHTNVVKFFERFDHMGQTCLAFEMLDRSLYDLLSERDWKPLPLIEIRPIAKQLLVALDALKGLGILHTDIKPDNIMFVNKQDQPHRVKLIDFGEAIHASKVHTGLELQPGGYRAPEVALGLPISEAIDVWGVGCILAFLYLADNLFPVDCDYQMMKCMVGVLGQPEDHLLRAGKYTKYFFTEEGPTWRLMTSKEYKAANNVQPQWRNAFIELPSSLDDLVNIYPEVEAAEYEDRRTFVDLMKGLLHLNGCQRIHPLRALQHPFFTMSHLTQHPDSRAYQATSQTTMSICHHIRGDNDPATRSFEGTKAIVHYDDGRITGSSNWVPATYSYDEDPDPWSSDGELSSDGEQSSLSNDEDPAPWFSDGELPSLSCDRDPNPWSSKEGQPKDSYEDAPAPGSPNGGLLYPSYDQEPAVWSFHVGPPPCPYIVDAAASSSDGGQPKHSDADAPAPASSDRGLLYPLYDEDQAVWSFHAVPPPSSYNEVAAIWSSKGHKPRDFTAAAPAVPGCTKKLLRGFCTLFGQITAALGCCWLPTVDD